MEEGLNPILYSFLHFSLFKNSCATLRCGQTQRWTPWPLVVLTALCNSLLLSVSGTCDSLLTNRIQQKWQDITSMIALYKTVMSVCRFSPLLALMKQVIMLRWPTQNGSKSLAKNYLGTEGGLWLTASKKLRPSVHQADRNWILPTTTRVWKHSLPQSSLRWDHCPLEHPDCLETLNQRTQPSCAQSPRLSETDTTKEIKAYCFKPIGL